MLTVFLQLEVSYNDRPGEYVCKLKLLKLQPLEQVTTLIQPFRM